MDGPWVTLVDDALPAPLFRRLLAGVRRLGQERLRSSYQTTFWRPLAAPAQNTVDLAVDALRRRLGARLRGVEGVEWWLSRMRTSNVQVDFHQDRDNALFARTGRLRHPTWGSVLYLNRCRGGLLAVTREPVNPKNPALAPDRHDFDLVAPAPNRFTFFPGHLTHGVLDARGEIPHRRLPTERSWRLAVAINWWAQPPEGVAPYSAQRHYRALAAREAV